MSNINVTAIVILYQNSSVPNDMQARTRAHFLQLQMTISLGSWCSFAYFLVRVHVLMLQLVTDHSSGPGRAIGPVLVSVHTIT